MTTTTTDVTVTMTDSLAESLLAIAGFERNEEGQWWNEATEEGYWMTSEALVQALPFIAENAEV